ncbi:MAG: hypothetical protein A2201_08585 [Alicyclobacillus sp. RIFOXYA1_FULL_53_8]|nr:MAG: hypothetical protein A2201_08585 [Alicyclobacillus sp. RIFOXYA1_FULL_53_8]
MATAYIVIAATIKNPNSRNPIAHHVSMETSSPASATMYSQKFHRAARTLEIGIRNATVVNWYTAPITKDNRAPSVSRCVTATMDGPLGLPFAIATD